jgi:hypothetical protein
MKILKYAVIAFLFISCGARKVVESDRYHMQTSKGNAFPKMYETPPNTILIQPVQKGLGIAERSDVIVVELIPLLQDKGYYVLPYKPTQDIIQKKGILPQELGADAVLQIQINDLDKNSRGETWVSLTYMLREVKTNYVLWEQTKEVSVDSKMQGGSGDFGEAVVRSLITFTATSSVSIPKLIKRVNEFAIDDLPYGSKHPNFGTDDTDYIWVLK